MSRREYIIPHVHIIDGYTDEERQRILDAQKTIVARHIVAKGRPPENRRRRIVGSATMSFDEAQAWLASLVHDQTR